MHCCRSSRKDQIKDLLQSVDATLAKYASSHSAPADSSLPHSYSDYAQSPGQPALNTHYVQLYDRPAESLNLSVDSNPPATHSRHYLSPSHAQVYSSHEQSMEGVTPPASPLQSSLAAQSPREAPWHSTPLSSKLVSPRDALDHSANSYHCHTLSSHRPGECYSAGKTCRHITSEYRVLVC